MRFAKRIVLDTSTLIGAVLRENSISRQVLIKALSEGELCASLATIAELEEVIAREKFDRSLNIPCSDPRDNKFLALALACRADVLVSSDDDLLILNPYGEILVLAPKAYLANSERLL
jgi:predicted nucleic acid-binding protein